MTLRDIRKIGTLALALASCEPKFPSITLKNVEIVGGLDVKIDCLDKECSEARLGFGRYIERNGVEIWEGPIYGFQRDREGIKNSVWLSKPSERLPLDISRYEVLRVFNDWKLGYLR